ncbi:MAG: hypothetical protein LBQ89_03170 [Treponema sp.]|jgi:ribosome-associated toxin RatA of RatAB toxin-antitoxin module|nr:hypothetical protein [Treponema sp.]
MKKLLLTLAVAFILLSCFACDKRNTATNQNTQVEVQQTQPEVPFERLRNSPNYESDEGYLRMQIELHYDYNARRKIKTSCGERS